MINLSKGTMPKRRHRISAWITLVLMTCMLCAVPYLESAHALEPSATSGKPVISALADSGDCCPDCPPDEHHADDHHCCCTHQLQTSNLSWHLIVYRLSSSTILRPFERQQILQEVYLERFIPPDLRA